MEHSTGHRSLLLLQFYFLEPLLLLDLDSQVASMLLLLVLRVDPFSLDLVEVLLDLRLVRT